MTLAGFIAYSGALAIAAAIPGPGLTALIARALGSGFRSALFMSLGLVLGDLTYLTAVVFWTAGISAEKIEAKRGSGGALASVLSGLAVTLGNPKTMIFYIALTPTLIDLHAITPTDYALLASVTVVTLLVVLVPYLALASKARWFLQSPRALKRLNRTAA
eukprot:gene25370-30455_t